MLNKREKIDGTDIKGRDLYTGDTVVVHCPQKLTIGKIVKQTEIGSLIVVGKNEGDFNVWKRTIMRYNIQHFICLIEN